LQGLQSAPVLKAGLISGSLSLLGDLIAQALVQYGGGVEPSSTYEPSRSLRMGTFGLFFYGPYQHYWYRALDRAFPARTMVNFASKVFLNQACLAPLVIGGVFAWNLALQKKAKEWPDKMRQDFVSTLTTGWKFWVPASSVNFLVIPLRQQVLYMSACGVVWTAFLSYSSAIAAQPRKQVQ
jgi:protein Mpv17